MFLRAAILVLLVLNLGVGAWWWLAGVPAPAPTQASANVEGVPVLRLAAAARPATAAVARPSPAPSTNADAPVVPPAPTPAATPGEVCLSFGPFADAAARDALRPALASALQLVPREQPARPARGWRVMLPAQASREAAVALAERIKAAGISDLYVMGAGPDANSIALGRFGSEAAARRREAELRGKGFAAQALPVGGGPGQWWLDVRLPATADRAAVAAFGPSRPVACDTLR
jgi:hypothetical protein